MFVGGNNIGTTCIGVNEHQIPFFVSTHPGNTSDIEMFDEFLKTLRSKYGILNNKVNHKILIMDQGNVSKEHWSCVPHKRGDDIFRPHIQSCRPCFRIPTQVLLISTMYSPYKKIKEVSSPPIS